jgi:hypothetical protein
MGTSSYNGSLNQYDKDKAYKTSGKISFEKIYLDWIKRNLNER